uniref:Polypeptide N-acetylgalactosaminyltransferase n=1 Tax=Culicoides sonorensis TaxID=179676 RepID=A0A336N3D7_CULSO
MMSPSKFRKIIVLLCIFTIFFIICMIFQIGFNRRSLNVMKPKLHSQNSPYWMPDEVDDMNLIISRPSIGKHPPTQDFVKIWPYKGLGSERLAFNRAIRNTRPLECSSVKYSSHSNSVSIVMSFHNEFVGVILRTLFSIEQTTPSKLIKEIILVDDASTAVYLDEHFENEIQKIFKDKIQLIRLKKRQGIHKALRIGLELATSDIVVIMPSHLETHLVWLPPLLEPILTNPRIITTPVVEYQHWNYNSESSTEILDGRGVFDLEFNIFELPNTENNEISNFRTPIIDTGIIVANREFLLKIVNKKSVSGIDGNLIELSLKTWLCFDGEIFKVPCAKMSHNFKEIPIHESSLLVNQENRDRELKQIILGYLGSYQERFLNFTPNRFKEINVKDMKLLKNTQNCKSFKYFLSEIASDMAATFIETPSMTMSGLIASKKEPSKCLDTFTQKPGSVISINSCSNSSKSKFALTSSQDIRLEKRFLCWNAYDSFLYRGSNVSLVAIMPCNTMEGRQKFEYDMKHENFRKIGTNFCLDVNFERKIVALTNCDETKLTQRWVWV